MEQVVEAVRVAMGGMEMEGLVDIEVAGDGLEVDVIGDEWTLHLEGWPERSVAFLAIEDEPEDAAAAAAARAAVMTDGDARALADLDKGLDGTLVAALRASGDPLSADLAAAIERVAPET